MKKLSEVAKITGVSRRTLQEYDRIGLVKPSAKTDAGYWLYNDDSIYIIFVVQIFREIGYEREAIKNILYNPDSDIDEEFKKATEMLHEKKKKIEGMISYINQISTISKLPSSTLSSITDTKYLKLYSENDFLDVMKETVELLSELNTDEAEDANMIVTILLQISGLANMMGQDATSQQVQDYINTLYLSYVELVNKMYDETVPKELIYDTDTLNDFKEMITEVFLEDDTINSYISSLSGEESLDYIKTAILYFVEHKKQ